MLAQHSVSNHMRPWEKRFPPARLTSKNIRCHELHPELQSNRSSYPF